MSLKLKALGLGLVAALAMSAIAVVNASAITSGHFTADEPGPLHITEHAPPNNVQLHAFGNSITCEEPLYSSSTAATTVTEITVTPTYKKCHSANPKFTAHVDMNGCDYKFTSRTSPETNHVTTHLFCPGPNPTGPVVTVTGSFGECWIEITPNQTPTNGATLTTGLGPTGKHNILAHITASNIHAVITKGGFFQCGTGETTTATAQMTGTATINATNSSGVLVGITAT